MLCNKTSRFPCWPFLSRLPQLLFVLSDARSIVVSQAGKGPVPQHLLVTLSHQIRPVAFPASPRQVSLPRKMPAQDSLSVGVHLGMALLVEHPPIIVNRAKDPFTSQRGQSLL
jgi:hypothetical protein